MCPGFFLFFVSLPSCSSMGTSPSASEVTYGLEAVSKSCILLV